MDSVARMAHLGSLRELLDSLPDALVIVETATQQILDFNRRLPEQTAYEPDELRGMSVRRLYDPSSLVRYDAALEEFRSRGEVRDVHLRVRRKDGDILEISVNATAIRDQHGRVMHSRSLWRDITDVVRREEELRRTRRSLRSSEDRHRTLVEAAPVCIVEIDLEGRMLSMNATGLELHGLRLSEIVARPFLSTIHADDRRRVAGVLERARNEPTDFEARCGPDGGLLMDVKLVPLRDEGDRPVQLLGVAVDITERKALERALRRSAERLEANVAERTRELADANRFLDSIVENIPDMIFVKDAQDLRFVRFNRAGEQLLGYARAELIGKNDYDVFPRGEADFFTGKDREVLASGELLDIPEEPIQTRELGERLLHTKKIPIFDEESRPRYLLGISEDITERRRAERELQRATADLEAFCHSVSHDIRSPLRAMSGFADLLLESHADGLSDEGAHYLERIRDNAVRLGEMVEGLLSLARLGRVRLSPRPLDLETLAREELARLVEAEPGIPVSLDVQPMLRPRADESLVRVVLSNLLSNSIRFRRDEADGASIVLGMRDPNGEPAFFVRDDGIGFSADPAQLFLMFQRGHPARDDEGMGVGLALVKRIVERHRGRVWAESEPGRGATFYFTLPDR